MGSCSGFGVFRLRSETARILHRGFVGFMYRFPKTKAEEKSPRDEFRFLPTFVGCTIVADAR